MSFTQNLPKSQANKVEILPHSYSSFAVHDKPQFSCQFMINLNFLMSIHNNPLFSHVYYW